MKIIHGRKYVYTSLIWNPISSETFSAITYDGQEGAKIRCKVHIDYQFLRVSFSYHRLFRTLGRILLWS